MEYENDGAKIIVLFEPVNSNTLESRFDPIGSIINQRLIKGDDTSGIAKDFVAGMGVDAVKGEYRDVVLQKACPSCGNTPLSRYIDTMFSIKEVPVMPLYLCGKCNTRSYYLTDEYLKNLVKDNSVLFEETELAEMSKDEGTFMTELRAYIIRIFASQRVMQIK